jgi:hypothetical protein
LELLTFLELETQLSETFESVLNAQINFADRITELLALVGEQDVAGQLGSF